MLLSRLLVELGLKDNLGPGLEKSKKGVKDWAKDLGNLGRDMSTKVTAPVVAGFSFMINSASDLNESTTAVQATYGDAADTIIAASKGSATAVGLSQQAYLDASKTLGVYATSAGLSGDAMAQFGTETIGAAADLASFHNADISDVLAAIQSGLSGETEPLRKYGILINEAAIQQKAMEMGLVDANGEISEQNKVLARQQLIMDQLGPAAGDFAETSGGLANQTRIAKAELANLSAELGQILLPYVLKAVKHVRTLMKRFQGLSTTQKKWILIIAAIAAALGPVLILISAMIPAVSALAAVVGLLISPIGLIVLALVGLGIAYKTNLFGFRDAVNAVARVLWDVIQPIVAFGKALFDAFTSGKPVKELVEQFPGPLQGVIKQFLLIADSIGDLVAAFRSGGLSGLLKQIPEELETIARAFLNLHKEILGLFLEGLQAAWPYVLEFVKSIPGWIWDALGGLADYLVPKGKDLLAGLWAGLKDKWDPGIKGWIKDLPGEIVEALGAVTSTLSQKGRLLISGLKAGLEQFWDPTLKNWLGRLPGAIVSAVGDVLTTLKKKGVQLLAGLKDGITDRWNNPETGVKVFFTSLPGNILKALTGAIADAASDLIAAGSSIIGKIKSGMGTAFDGGIEGGASLLSWIAGIPGKIAGHIASAVANAYNALYNAGWAIIKAFWDGISGAWNSLIPDMFKNIIGATGVVLGVDSVSAASVALATAAPPNGPVEITININGYNRDPDDLANEVARVLNRRFNMAGGMA